MVIKIKRAVSELICRLKKVFIQHISFFHMCVYKKITWTIQCDLIFLTGGTIEMLAVTVLYQTQHTMLNILVLNAVDNDVWISTKNYNEIDKCVKQ